MKLDETGGICVNAFDREFWNGSLKTAILIEHDVKKLLREYPDSQEGIEIALKRIGEIKGSIETLNGNGVMKRLRVVELEEE
jgi:hypothetical protein